MADELNHLEVQMDGLDIVYHPSFYNIAKSNEIFEQLKQMQFNSDEDSEVLIAGKWRKIPRKQTSFGDEGTSYNFSGHKVESKEWPSFLREIRDDLQQYLIDKNILPPDTSKMINYVLVNLYRDGNDYIGPHSDDEKDLLVPIIMSLSFGETRDFIFHNKKNLSATYNLSLQNGDLVIMKGDTQKKWKHSLPKRLKVKNTRINLTFRFIKPKILISLN